MKKVLFICCLLPHLILSQDVIIKTNGEELLSKVIEIDGDKIKYKKHENPEGPIYSITKPEVFMIKYANGSKDIMAHEESQRLHLEGIPYGIEGAWINKLLSDDIIRIAMEDFKYFITIKGAKAPLTPLKTNEYALQGSSIRAFAVSKDSIYLKDIEDPASPKLYLVRTTAPVITEPTATQGGVFGLSASAGFGPSYAGIGINGALRIGSREFSLQPNVGLGLFTYTLDGTLPISIGAKLYFGNIYIGYRYGYLGSATIVDYYGYPDFVDVDGSVLVFGSDWYFGKKKNWFFTSGFGINISGIKLDINDADFDLGFGIRY